LYDVLGIDEGPEEPIRQVDQLAPFTDERTQTRIELAGSWLEWLSPGHGVSFGQSLSQLSDETASGYVRPGGTSHISVRRRRITCTQFGPRQEGKLGMEPVKAAIIYYSATGTVHALAEAAALGAEKAGAQVRLRKVRELAPASAIEVNPAWRQHLRDTADVPRAALDDLAWADAVVLGTPTRFGTPASQLKAFLDTTGPLWQAGQLADKVYTAFTASQTAHGGQEATLLALSHVFYHWGGIIVPPGYTDPIQFQSGNPYGASHVAGGGPPDDVARQAAHYQARRAVDVAAALKAGRATSSLPTKG
jgi:NAD(P)H dehydrogenase (quinone)